jgi:predicted glycoside hydrolase/deacetylase ChbG (UPF0249 family)
MSDRWLIVNADDLGLCAGVDTGILETIREGIVTSVSLLVNPPHATELAPFVEAAVSVGLHLNLTLGLPCSPADGLRCLVDQGGRFRTDGHEQLSELDAAEVRRELGAQVERFRELTGRHPSHLDFHKHLHRRDDAMLEIGIELARETGVPLRCVNEPMRERCRAAGCATTDHFIGDVRPAPYWTLERLRSELAALPPGITEMMCHPGRDVGAIEGLWYLAERQTERETLISAEARELLDGIELTSFLEAPLAGAKSGGTRS